MDQMIKYDPDYELMPFGLVNTGVICHFNSLIQALLSCPAFVKVVIKDKDKHNMLGAKLYNLIVEADNLKNKVRPIDLLNNTTPTLSAVEVLKELVTQHKIQRDKDKSRFSANMQESACEGFVLLIDLLNIPELESLFKQRFELVIECPTCKERTSTQSDYTLHYTFRRLMKFTDKGMFCQYMQKNAEELEDYTCEKCKTKHAKIYRVYRLAMAPEIMVVIFNKYSRKINCWYPDTLTFPCPGDKNINYKAVAQIEHFGGMNGGHYIAKGIRKNGVKLFNDTHTGPANFTPTDASFMVFYHFTGYTVRN